MQNVPPDASLDALLKLLSAPTVSYILIFLVQRRRLLLSLLQAIFKVVSQQEEKRKTDEMPAANGNGQKLVLLNLENVMARIDDTGEDVRDAHRRLDKERRERLDSEMTISAELAKLTLRIEDYRKQNQEDSRQYADTILKTAKSYTDTQVADLRGHIDEQMDAMHTTMRRNFDDLKEMIQELAA